MRVCPESTLCVFLRQISPDLSLAFWSSCRSCLFQTGQHHPLRVTGTLVVVVVAVASVVGVGGKNRCLSFSFSVLVC